LTKVLTSLGNKAYCKHLIACHVSVWEQETVTLAIANRLHLSSAHLFAEDICSVSSTFKSRLMVTQGHWKWNHWLDHIPGRVIWHWILSWPFNVGYRSLKVIENHLKALVRFPMRIP